MNFEQVIELNGRQNSIITMSVSFIVKVLKEPPKRRPV